MNKRIKTNDLVKIISGSQKGFVGKVLKVDNKNNTALIDGVGNRERHMKKTAYNPAGGKKDIQVPVLLDKLALVVDEKTNKTSRVGLSRDEKGKLVRVARQVKNKEIK
ncbi:MAG: 50S ribosomal protein L24 [Candidatus Nomurabacteria bacterium]|jgi:large subunit ribosomal protein L24|nr:50S ribosomal protein L24 [Candidatus Nomurabacteria bacterium]